MTDRDDERLREQLAELESTLDELGTQLRAEQRTRGPPRPPTPGELLRFTDRYTIPAVIGLLEATIRSLELLQGLLRLADPDRSGIGTGRGGRGTRDRLSNARSEASDQLSTALSGLRTALSEANENLPEDPQARSVIEDARDLSREIEDRLDSGPSAGQEPADPGTASGDDGGAERGRIEGPGIDGGVRIEVTDGSSGEAAASGSDGATGDGDGDATDAGAADADPEEPEVDVEAELESIKREFDDDASGGGSTGQADGDESGDPGESVAGPPAESASESAAESGDADEHQDENADEHQNEDADESEGESGL